MRCLGGMKVTQRKCLFVAVLALVSIVYFSLTSKLTSAGTLISPCSLLFLSKTFSSYASSNNRIQLKFNKQSPVVFITGVTDASTSGLDLMHQTLFAKSGLGCASSTDRLVSDLIHKSRTWTRSSVERERLGLAGVTQPVIDSAVRGFLLETLVRKQAQDRQLFLTTNKTRSSRSSGSNRNSNGDSIESTIFCSRDSSVSQYAEYVASRLLPNAKIVLMIRDPRAISAQLITRHSYLKDMIDEAKQSGLTRRAHSINMKAIEWIAQAGISTTNYKQALIDWNLRTQPALAWCLANEANCLPVYFEQLVIDPQASVSRVENFIFNRHKETNVEDEIVFGGPVKKTTTKSESDKNDNDENEREEEQLEKSLRNIVKPFRTKLYDWRKEFPIQLMNMAPRLAPEMKRMGYGRKSRNVNANNVNTNIIYSELVDLTTLRRNINGNINNKTASGQNVDDDNDNFPISDQKNEKRKKKRRRRRRK